MALVPRGVGHLGDHGVEAVVGVEAVEEGDRIHSEAEGARVGEEAHGSRRTPADRGSDGALHGFGPRPVGIPEVVAASEPGPGRPTRRSQPGAREEPVELGKIGVELEERVGEAVRARREAPVPHDAEVEGALHLEGDYARAVDPDASTACAARRPLQAPSSWKPYRQ